MKQQTFDLFDDNLKNNYDQEDFELDLENDPSASDIIINPNQTEDLEEIDIEKHFDDDYQELIMESDNENQDDVFLTNNVDNESIEEEITTSTLNYICDNDDNLKTLDTVQFSQELGNVTIIDNEEVADVIEINLESDAFNEITPEKNNFGQLKIMVFGLGGCGCNIISRMYDQTLDDIKLVAIDSDADRLKKYQADEKILVGSDILHGNGSGLDTNKVLESFRKSEPEIIKLLDGIHMLFIVGSLSGGTGSVGLVEVGKLAKSLGILTVGFAIAPLRVETDTQTLNQIHSELVASIDSTILVDSQRILEETPSLPVIEVQELVDQVLIDGIKGIYELATKPGLINLDYADIKTAFSNRGSALMSIGYGRGENNILDAVSNALHSQILDDGVLDQAELAIVAISAPSHSVRIKTANKAALIVSQISCKSKEPLVLFGWTIDESLGDRVKATIVISSANNQEIKDVQKEYIDDDINDFLASIDRIDDKNPSPNQTYQPENEELDFITPNASPEFSVADEENVSFEEKEDDFPDFF